MFVSTNEKQGLDAPKLDFDATTVTNDQASPHISEWGGGVVPFLIRTLPVYS